MATFTFGDTFLNQLNRGQQLGTQQAVSKAELQMRAKQLQEEVLNAQLNREQTRLQMTLDQAASERAENLTAAQVENLGATTEATRTATEISKEDQKYLEEVITLPNDVSEILGIPAGTKHRRADFLDMLEAARQKATGDEQARLARLQGDMLEDRAEAWEQYKTGLKDLYDVERGRVDEFNQQSTTIKRSWEAMSEEERAQYGSYKNFREESIKNMKASGINTNVDLGEERRIERQRDAIYTMADIGGQPNFKNIFLAQGKSLLNTFGVGRGTRESFLENRPVQRQNLLDPAMRKGEQIRSGLALQQMQNPDFLAPYQPGFLRGVYGSDPTPSFLQSGVQTFFPYTATPMPQLPVPPQDDE